MSNVVYAPEADDDMVGIVDYIARDKPQAARGWIASIRGACETLASQPEMGEFRPGFGVPGCRILLGWVGFSTMFRRVC